MLSFAEIRNCEGYYYNVRTGTILRIVRPDHGDWPGRAPLETAAAEDPHEPVFELVVQDPHLGLVEVEAMVRQRYSAEPKFLVSRETAEEPECDLSAAER